MTITIYGDVSRNHSGTISCVRCGTCLAERKYLKAKQDRTVILMNNLTSVSSKLNVNIDTVARKNFYLCVILNYCAITLEKSHYYQIQVIRLVTL
jgi:hypothetical protein